MDVSTSSATSIPWPPTMGPNSLPGPGNQDVLHPRLPPPPLHHPQHPRLGPPPPRVPIRPFFVREIYKNGFLKRLAHNEKKSSALAKLMRSDRYWVVFSVHDLGADQMPFLELWHEPTEVATKPPQFMFPLAVCQHISPSLVPADNEWTFVVNFETVAIRFSCNSRQTMEEWVDCIRLKLCEMGILNPKGNLYSKVPLLPGQVKPPAPNTGVGRNPMSPLPEPPSAGLAVAEPDVPAMSTPNDPSDLHQPRSRGSILDPLDQINQSFTTSIYLNQSSQQSEVGATAAPASAAPVVSTPQHVIPAKSYEPVTVVSSAVSTSAASATVKTATPARTTVTTPSASGIKGVKWSVYLSKNKPARHVTVIPINNNNNNNEVESKPSSPQHGPEKDQLSASLEELQMRGSPDEEAEGEHFYDAIFELDEPVATSQPSKSSQNTCPRQKRERRRQQSPPQNAPPLPSSYETIILQSTESRVTETSEPRRSRGNREGGKSPQHQIPFKEPVSRRYSDRRESRHPSGQKQSQHQPVRIRKKSQRSSSLGPLLDDNQLMLSASLAQRSANTNSLESIDSNPRRAVAKNDHSHHPYSHQHHRDRDTGAVPRRPLQAMSSLGQTEVSTTTQGPNALMGSPPRGINDFPRPLPPYIPLVLPGITGTTPAPPGGHPPHPPHIPLPGLTCQLSVAPPPQNDLQLSHTLRPSLREQQVIRLRQEIAHPAGVRLTLRKRDCQGSLALVEFFGCLWVAGWRQRDFPVLYNAFHIGDQILSVGGVPVKTASEFNKFVKQKSSPNLSNSNLSNGQEIIHVEIVIRRLPFAQVFHLKREVEGQPLGIVTSGNTSEIREIVPSSPAAQHGMTAKIRSFDGQTLVPWVLTEINGRPLNLFGKDGEAGDRLQALGRDVSVLLQPADIVSKLKKQLKSHRNYKEFLLG